MGCIGEPMKKFFFITGFFTLAPLLFFFSILFYLFLAYQKAPAYSNNPFFVNPKSVAYAALPTNGNLYAGTIAAKDGRVEMVRQFLARYDSPLAPYAEHIVAVAEKYGIDHRLIPAIAMQETNLCLKAKAGSHNCWGFGVYDGKYKYFANYAQAIDIVTKTLATKYKKTHGLVTPEEIMTMYTPSSNGTWAYSVNHFMNQLQ